MNGNGLTTGDFTTANDPIALFGAWLNEAEDTEINDPGALALATVDADGMPNVRMVLLKDFDARGFVFYTNFESSKGRELLSSHKAAMCFHWKTLRRQVRIRGTVEVVTDAEADAYYDSRPVQSRIGAWASQQSRPLDSRATLEQAASDYAEKFALDAVPRPGYWSGFRVIPSSIEFWKDGAFRLHDRIVFEQAGNGWEKTRLYP